MKFCKLCLFMFFLALLGCNDKNRNTQNNVNLDDKNIDRLEAEEENGTEYTSSIRNNTTNDTITYEERDRTALYEELDMTDAQIEEFEQKNREFRQEMENNRSESKNPKLVIERHENKALKAILSQDQYDRYLEIQEEENNNTAY